MDENIHKCSLQHGFEYVAVDYNKSSATAGMDDRDVES